MKFKEPTLFAVLSQNLMTILPKNLEGIILEIT